MSPKQIKTLVLLVTAIRLWQPFTWKLHRPPTCTETANVEALMAYGCPVRPRSLTLDALEAIPGISAKRAQILQPVLNNSLKLSDRKTATKQIQSVNGFGKKRSKILLDFISPRKGASIQNPCPAPESRSRIRPLDQFE